MPLTHAHLRFTLVADPAGMPPFWGPALRGILGYGLRRAALLYPAWPLAGRPLPTAEAAAMLFNGEKNGGRRFPVPFALEVPAPLDAQPGRGALPSADSAAHAVFGMVLYGEATGLAPLVIEAFRLMEHEPLGRLRASWRLAGVEDAGDGCVLWRPETGLCGLPQAAGMPAASPLRIFNIICI